MKTMFYFLGSVLLCCHLLFASAEREINNFSNNHLVITASSYANFLNNVAATDFYQLYEEKMGAEVGTASILRSGQPGSYHYEAIGEESKEAITYLSYYEIGSYLRWLGALNKDVSSKIDPYLKINRNEFQINDISTVVAFQCSGNQITGSSFAEIIEEGAVIAALALEGGITERNQIPGHRVEERERVSPLVERQEAIEEQIVSVQEALLETNQAAPRKASVELTRRALAIFFNHYLSSLKEHVQAFQGGSQRYYSASKRLSEEELRGAIIVRHLPISLGQVPSSQAAAFNKIKHDRINEKKIPLIQSIERYQKCSEHTINYRMLLGINPLQEATNMLKIDNIFNFSEYDFLRKLDDADLLIEPVECIIKFLKAKAAGQSQLARVLRRAAVFYEDGYAAPYSSYNKLARKLAKADEEFIKADKIITDYQAHIGDSIINQKVIGMNFAKYNKLIIDSAEKYKEALAAGSLLEADYRWDAISILEKAFQYGKKFNAQHSKKDKELADSFMEAFGYFYEIAEKFCAAHKAFVVGDKESAFCLGKEGLLFKEVAPDFLRAALYGEKATTYANEAKNVTEQEAVVKNWISLQYKKEMQSQLCLARKRFLEKKEEPESEPAIDNEDFTGSEVDFADLLSVVLIEDVVDSYPSLVRVQIKHVQRPIFDDYPLVYWIEEVNEFLGKGPGMPYYKLIKAALPYLKNAVKYHEEASKADLNGNEEESRCWHQAADRTDAAIKDFNDSYKYDKRTAGIALKAANRASKQALQAIKNPLLLSERK